MDIATWEKWCEKNEQSFPEKSQRQMTTLVQVRLSSCEWSDPHWVPTIEEWRAMLERTKSLVTAAGFVFELEDGVDVLSSWFWRYHWREMERELFKQYAITMAAHFNGDISALMNGVWDEVLKESAGKENLPQGHPEECFKSSPVLWRHLMNVCEIPGCRIVSKEP